MSSELVPSRGSFAAARESRQVSRELARLEGQGRVDMARVGQAADLHAERLSAVAYVGKRAMHEVTLLTQLEVQLVGVVPSALSRIQGLGDMTALAMAEVVAETVRKVS